MRWPWRRHPDPGGNGEAAAAKEDASRKLADAMGKRREVEQARDRFAALIEQALRGTR